MTLYSMYIVDSINEIVNVIKHLHKIMSKHEEILSGKQSYWYKNNILERRIIHMVFNSLLYLQYIYRLN